MTTTPNGAAAPREILDLVQRFNDNREAYASPSYNETKLRIDFLNPFFEALGWDVSNKQGFAEAYKEVVHEDTVKVGTATKAPDYSFRIGGQRKFFVEAKKPFVNIKDDIDPAFQVRRYAWSAKLPLSILTDFEEFSVYDCRVKPVKTDKASVCRLLYIRYDEYEARWTEIAGIFSKDAINKGSFDKFAADSKRGRGASEVDDAFLAEIEAWRDLLARNIALRNENLSPRELNFAVQRTIDRLIFLRICEDRGIEEYGRLLSHLNGDNIYKRLCVLFREADDRYNSGIFHFREEKGREETPDAVTLKLDIDDKALKQIIENLYYPESAYEFSVLPADILGQVYEQFLGKVIRLTAGHQAKVEDKPEVKKAGGVFYTPTYIVDYIVKNIVGKLLENKTPKQAATLRILDPACGSGSFLIGAYQYLLDWHRDWYCNNGPEKWQTGKNPTLYKAHAGEYRLTTAERKRILLNNIYGVDIDTQAVEVTKLSLLLKVLEGENEQSISQQLKLFHQRALPDLGNNIKCGNSLIGTDFYEGVQETLALYEEEDEERYKINAFDWNEKKGFEEIMKGGGFDAVIGNPPYGAAFSEDEKDYIKRNFKTYKYRFDSYIYFIERAISITKDSGFTCFITPELWLKLENCDLLRRYIAKNMSINTIRICGENVFADAVVNTVISVFQKKNQSKNITIELETSSWKLPVSLWKSSPGLAIEYRSTPQKQLIIERIAKEKSIPLENLGSVIQGITPYDKYQGQTEEVIKSRAYHFKSKKDSSCGKWLEGKDVGRYSLDWSGEWLRYGPWLAAPREPKYFNGPRILFREVPGANRRIQAAFIETTLYHGHSITPFKPLKDINGVSPLYLLGIVNSKLLSWYGGIVLPNFGKEVFPKLNPQDIKQLPIRSLNLNNSNEKSLHDKIVFLVSSLLSLHQKLKTATGQLNIILQREIEAKDRRIDELVYELFGLTPEEIKIVEGT
jgi:type I restriction-modification system DNA methylase subunit/predicted type IV restriction endonuclease